MPALRVNNRRRRSSLAMGLTQVKPGTYGIPPRNVTFAPNVTPGTYVDPEASLSDSDSPSASLFPPSELPAPPPARRRVPPGKRRSQGYIPRPPNAFMLFRADFVRQKHVPGSIETNHGSLSKIIGNCWRALPLEEKRVWETRAKKAKADHRERYPDYRFRPVHNKNKVKPAAAPAPVDKKPPMLPPDEQRCEEVAQLLLEGMKGDELAAAVRRLDLERGRSTSRAASPDIFSTEAFSFGMPAPFWTHRRSSSVPPPSTLYNPITIPALPFLVQNSRTREQSIINNISRANRAQLGLSQRRASSVQPVPSRSWTMPMMNMDMVTPEIWQLQRDWSPLPEMDASLFEQSFIGDGGFAFPASQNNDACLGDNFMQNFENLQQPDLTLDISPLETISSQPLANVSAGSSAPSPFAVTPSFSFTQPFAEGNVATEWQSAPSSTFSGSPAPSDVSLPQNCGNGVIAPQPQHPLTGFESFFNDNVSTFHVEQQHQYHVQQQYQQEQQYTTVYQSDSQFQAESQISMENQRLDEQSLKLASDLGVGMDSQLNMDMQFHLQDYAAGLECAALGMPFDTNVSAYGF